MNIGECIRDYRKKNGLSQKELGKKLDVSQQHIAQYENSKRIPKLDTLKKIASALEVSLSDLMNTDEIDKAIRIETKEQLKRLIDSGTLTSLPSDFISDYLKLNDTGKQEAEKRVHELTEISRYIQNEESNPDRE